MGANPTKPENSETPKPSLKRRLTFSDRTVRQISSALHRSSTKRVLTGPRLRQTIRPCSDGCEEHGLLTAVERGHRACVMKHLIGGASPDTGTTQEDMPLIQACKNPEILEMLLEFGCDVDARVVGKGDVPAGRTALHFAAAQGNLPSVRLLLHYGANADPQDADNVTPLMLSWNKSEDHVTNYLLRMLLRENKAGTWGHHALLQSCQHGQLEFVKLLCNEGRVDPNCHDVYDGLTPLMAASRSGHEKVVRFLLDRKVDMTCCDRLRHLTAEDYARSNGHKECLYLLQNAKRKASIKNIKPKGYSSDDLQVVLTTKQSTDIN